MTGYWKIRAYFDVSFNLTFNLNGNQKESNLLKYNVAGDCLPITLEGDLTKYFEQIQFWSEIEFLPPSFPLPLY